MNKSLKIESLVVGLILILISEFSFSQNSEYKIYYYSDSTIASEGTLVNGKPNDYWKTYYPDGVLKNIGKRTDFLLDSIWNFYNPKGFLEKKISYFEGKKNGFYTEFYPSETNSYIKYKLIYVNDLRQGLAEYYTENQSLEKTIPFVNNVMQGQGFEYNSDSLKIAINWYENNKHISRQIINRTDSLNRKSGTWIDFYANGNIKTESNYDKGKLNGIYKLFDSHQRLLRVGNYENDSLVYSSQTMVDFEEPFEKITYYNDSTIKYRGSYKDKVPIGIHRFYNKNQEVDSSLLYNEYGTFLGRGIILENGEKQGFWKFYYPNKILKEEGYYENNLRTKNWKFYYETGELKQEGEFYFDKPNGVWQWFFVTGELKKMEEYSAGLRNGFTLQNNRAGKQIVNGTYIDGKEQGEWKIQIGDIIQKGEYVYGAKDKVWKHYYTNGKLQFKGLYFNTKKHRRHVYYYDNGTIEHEEFYRLGKPIKKWEYFNRKGELLYSVYYKNGEEIKIVTSKK